MRVISLLSTQPGNLVYHLAALLFLYIIVLLAVGAGRRDWNLPSARLTVACGGALLGQFALMVAALLAMLGIADADSLLPPLERFVGVASIGLLLWAFIPLAFDFPQAGTVLAIGNLMVAALAYAISALIWFNQSKTGAPLAFNSSLLDLVWTVWAVGLLGLGLLALLVRLRNDWGLTGAAWMALLAGYVLHLLVGSDIAEIPHAQGWVRLATLVAYPLLAGVVVRRITEGAPAGAVVPVQPGGALSWQALEACRQVMDTPSLNAALQRAVSTIGATLDADIVAVGLMQAGQNLMGLAAVQQAGQPPKTGASFEINTQPAIQRAVAWQQPVIVVGGSDSDQAALRAVLGGGDGPLYIHPLVYSEEISGVLVAGRRKINEAWSDSAQQLLTVLATELATALAQRRRVERFSSELTQREAMLRQAREETNQLAARLSQEQSRRESESAAFAARHRQAQATSDKAVESANQPTVIQPTVVIPRPAEPVDSKSAQAIARAELPAYRNLFVEEARKHLDAMNSAFERLRDQYNDEALAQLFRSAHALKSMAAVMNYTIIARVAGLLSDAVKRVKSGTLTMSANLLALCVDTSHVLRVLLEDVRAGLSPSVDVAPLLERWGPFIIRSDSPQAATLPFAAPALRVRIELTPDCQLRAVRAMVILAQLRRVGKVLACQPDEQILRLGRIDGEFVITLATERTAAEVQSMISSIADIARVEIQ